MPQNRSERDGVLLTVILVRQGARREEGGRGGFAAAAARVVFHSDYQKRQKTRCRSEVA
jgi:hypothetical protein